MHSLLNKKKINSKTSYYIKNFEYFAREKEIDITTFYLFGYKAFSIKRDPSIYKSYHEIKVIRNDYKRIKDIETNKIKKLLNNLDKESLQNIICIFKRIEIISNSKKKRPKFDLFTQKEKQELKKIAEHKNLYTLEVSKDIFLYKNFLFPKKITDISGLYNKHGIPTLPIETQNKIKGNNIIDVGGFIGDSALILQEWLPKKIYTFEACPTNASLLRRTIELNNVNNIFLVEQALGNKDDIVYIENKCNAGATIQKKESINNTRISMTTLDNYVSQNNIKDIALIKVDIEGFEQPFLEGAQKTIKEQRPILLLSIYHSLNDFLEIKPIIEEWNLNYKFSIYNPTDGHIILDTLLICIPK